MEETEGNNPLALMLFESPLEVEPLNMIESFAGSTINDWSGTLYSVEGITDLNMMTGVPMGNMPDDGVVSELSLENQALIRANKELRTLVREMRRRVSAAERLSDDLQDVILARDDQISAYMNEIDQLRYKWRRMSSEISALEEEVGHLCHGQSSRRRR
ncbi:hypothetical protein Tco_0801440 [Tanacetum coccineum]|uniref:Uncharacterized protein n=1 Tax=Tanacetum coccineum TaxID=301880 RepID=A0ABQ4ZWU5_9ASTR